MNKDRWTLDDYAEYLGKQHPEIARPKHSKRDYKAELLQQLALAKFPLESEFKFLVDRQYRADWRIVGTRILIEFDGGLFQKGKAGHSSVAGILRDMEKINLAALNGWTVIRVAPNHVVSGQALNWIDQAVKREITNG